MNNHGVLRNKAKSQRKKKRREHVHRTFPSHCFFCSSTLLDTLTHYLPCAGASHAIQNSTKHRVSRRHLLASITRQAIPLCANRMRHICILSALNQSFHPGSSSLCEDRQNLTAFRSKLDREFPHRPAHTLFAHGFNASNAIRNCSNQPSY